MQQARDGRIDLFRGLALIFIFWDHIPGNPLGLVTMRNFGLSDAAELFVFLAGFGAALSYGATLNSSGTLAACVRVLRRVGTLYIAHIFVLVLLMGVVFLTNSYVETRDFITEMHLEHFVAAPEQGLIDALTLRFKPNLLDPLPLYIALLLAFALVLPLLPHHPIMVLGLSGALYAATVHFNWNLPSQDGSGWFFNPLAWQFLFFIGAAMAMHGHRVAKISRHPLLLTTAAIVLLASAFLVWTWQDGIRHDAIVPTGLAQWLYPIDKTNLDPLRLIHFLAVAVIVRHLLPQGAWLMQAPFRHVRRLGRHSLEIYCLGVVCAPLADIASTLAGGSAIAQIGSGVFGVISFYGVALALDWNRQLSGRAGRPIPAPEPAGKGPGL